MVNRITIPVWPSVPRPQLYTSPWSVSTNVWSAPHTIWKLLHVKLKYSYYKVIKIFTSYSYCNIQIIKLLKYLDYKKIHITKLLKYSYNKAIKIFRLQSYYNIQIIKLLKYSYYKATKIRYLKDTYTYL